jgi:signal transduction histidine kinase
MRLHDFLRTRVDTLLSAWEHEFSRDDAAGHPMERRALRHLTKEIVLGIASELETGHAAQVSIVVQAAKVEATPASSHGGQRLAIGYTLQQLLAEYHLLRQVVTREWVKVRDVWRAQEIVDMANFNAALDRALGLSTSAYVAGLDYSRDLFIGVLGHDLRGPINAALLNIHLIDHDPNLGVLARTALERTERSVNRMNDMVAELLDFTSGRFGLQRHLALSDVSLSRICEEVIDELRMLHPGRQIDATLDPDTMGRWDAHRLRQAVSNLLRNAIEHGTATLPISVATRGDSSTVTVEVRNQGRPIHAGTLATVFNPFTQGTSGEADTQIQGSIGLGLFIVRDVVVMHEGTISVDSTAERGTVFRIDLPRQAREIVPVA